MPSDRHTAGRRRSPSISSTRRVLDRATARLQATEVLPSPSSAELTAITLMSCSNPDSTTDVASVRIASANRL